MFRFDSWNSSLEVEPVFPLKSALLATDFARSVSFKTSKPRGSKLITSITVNIPPIEDFDSDSEQKLVTFSMSTRPQHLDFRYRIGSYAGTLTGGDGCWSASAFNFVMKLDSNGKPLLRKLSPVECELLQGWPSGHTHLGSNGTLSNNQRYDLCGNGISSPVVKAIVESFMMPCDVFSAFTGAAGAEIGLDKRKYNLIGYSEIKGHACKLLEVMYPTLTNFGDITKIDFKEVPPFDLLIGGFPCQAFSESGKRLGFEDIRGTLFFELARAMKEVRPKYCLFENVTGLATHDKGKTLQTILNVIKELNYRVDVHSLSSKDFGLRQDRNRLYIRCERLD